MDEQEDKEITRDATMRDSIRAELEATTAKYHALLESLTEEDWRRKSANPAWNVGQLMSHLAMGYSMDAKLVAAARRGKGMFNLPDFILNPMNSLMTKIDARKTTRQTVGGRYDAAHAAMLGLVDSLHDDEWQKSGKFFNGTMTVESIFHSVAGHFGEHEAAISAGLGRV